jgi:molybdopterin-synthase adenylyltransferase
MHRWLAVSVRVVGIADGPFARQALIPGWSQRRLENARVLVAGVGALGNACAADLALSGVGHLVLVDNDAIETSNLSRTILFRRGDEGRRKVDVAAERLVAIAPAEVDIVTLDTDVVWELGSGVYRRVDIVLGCLDSTEARVAVGAAAWSFGVPAIIGGLFGFDGGIVIQGVGEGACIGCTLSRAEWAERAARYSCDDVRRLITPRALVPATQVIASLTASLMVSEAVQILHGDVARAGARLFFAGRAPALQRMLLRQRPRCLFHTHIDRVREDGTLSSRMTAGAVLEHLAAEHGRRVRVELGRDFLLTARCKGCGNALSLARPRHVVTERDLVCEPCCSGTRPLTGGASLEIVRAVSLSSPPSVLDLSLESLGIPALQVLAISVKGHTEWYELTGDLERVLPGWGAMARQRSGAS